MFRKKWQTNKFTYCLVIQRQLPKVIANSFRACNTFTAALTKYNLSVIARLFVLAPYFCFFLTVQILAKKKHDLRIKRCFFFLFVCGTFFVRNRICLCVWVCLTVWQSPSVCAYLRVCLIKCLASHINYVNPGPVYTHINVYCKWHKQPNNH